MRSQSDIPLGSLHKSDEDYLETILILNNKIGLVRSIDIARHLNYSKPSIFRAVKVLSAAGYLTVDANHFIHLTEEGRKEAERIYGRHQFLTRFLILIGVDPETAEIDACELEHIMSEESFQALKSTYQLFE